MPSESVAYLHPDSQRKSRRPSGETAAKLTPMSFVFQAVRDSSYTHWARLAALCIAGRLDNRTEAYCISRERLATDMGCSTSTVDRAVEELTAGLRPLFLKTARKNAPSEFRLVRHASDEFVRVRQENIAVHTKRRGLQQVRRVLDEPRKRQLRQYDPKPRPAGPSNVPEIERLVAGIAKPMSGPRKVTAMPASGRQSTCDQCGAILEVRADGTVLEFVTQEPHVCPRA